MTLTIADYANENPASARLGSIISSLSPTSIVAPFDLYRSSVSDILGYGTDTRLNSTNFLGRLLLLGLVSAAEGYVRSVLASCMEICPVAQSASATKQINLGGLLWHGKTGFSRSAFENSSFSSKKELAKAFDDYIGFKLEDRVFKSVLDEFEVICQLRHGIVHSDGFLPGKNAVQLDIPRYDRPVRVIFKYMLLQEAASVIDTLVSTLNRELFFEMCRRWAISWRQRADWNTAYEAASFAKIWTIFHSASDRRTRAGRSTITRGKCMAEVKAEYGL